MYAKKRKEASHENPDAGGRTSTCLRPAFGRQASALKFRSAFLRWFTRRAACRLAVALIGFVIASLSSVNTFAGTILYTYDLAGRLTGANYGGGKSIGYTYDNAGNLALFQISLITPDSDSDADGMQDGWEINYFGNLSRDGAGDFDSDGLTDLDEFLSGTLPNDPDSVLFITEVALISPSSVTIEWTSLPGKRYQVQSADSLAPAQWTNLGAEITATETTSSMQDTRTIQGQRFYRVQLVP
jgi:YD repeat-containing protein